MLQTLFRQIPSLFLSLFQLHTVAKMLQCWSRIWPPIVSSISFHNIQRLAWILYINSLPPSYCCYYYYFFPFADTCKDLLQSLEFGPRLIAPSISFGSLQQLTSSILFCFNYPPPSYCCHKLSLTYVCYPAGTLCRLNCTLVVGIDSDSVGMPLMSFSHLSTVIHFVINSKKSHGRFRLLLP